MARIHDDIEILAPVEHVFRFCTDVRNLSRVFPKEIRVDVIQRPPLPLLAGAEIALRFHRAGLFYQWESIVTSCDPCCVFEDVQVRGPMKRWVSLHTFEPTPHGTRVIHVIDYEFQFGRLGRICGLVGMDSLLRKIFAQVHHATKRVAEQDWLEGRTGDDG